MNKIFRFIGILLHLFRGFFIFGFANNNDVIIKQGVNPHKRLGLANWLKHLLTLFSVEIIVHGDKVQAPKMIVSNHVSWIDILVLSFLYPGHFIAKSEIKKWPVMGAMITNIGTLFVKRGIRSEIKKLSQQIEYIISNQCSVIFFPEGKTGDGNQINRIHTGLFESAINAKMDIQPILLIYEDSSGYPSKTVPYINNQTLFSSIMDVFGEKKIIAHVFVLDSIPSQDISRKEIGTQLMSLLSLKLDKELNKSPNSTTNLN